jgi:hypothetical protein
MAVTFLGGVSQWRLKWELPNRLVSTFSSANSEKKARIVAQLLA